MNAVGQKLRRMYNSHDEARKNRTVQVCGFQNTHTDKAKGARGKATACKPLGGVRSRLLKKTGLQIHEVRPVPGGNSTSKSKLGSLGGKSPMRRNIASCFPQKPIQGSTSAPISFKSKNPMHLPSATTRHMVGWGGGPVRPDNSSCLSGAVKSSGSSSARASSSKSSEAKISKGKPVQIVFDDGFF